MDAEKIFRRIARNKHKKQPLDAAIKKHFQYVNDYREGLESDRQTLERRAFSGLEPQGVTDPIGYLKAAIRSNSPREIKQAACNAYDQGHYVAVKLASEFDLEIKELVDFLETFGELQSPPVRVFIELALAPPGDD